MVDALTLGVYLNLWRGSLIFVMDVNGGGRRPFPTFISKTWMVMAGEMMMNPTGEVFTISMSRRKGMCKYCTTQVVVMVVFFKHNLPLVYCRSNLLSVVLTSEEVSQ